MRGTIRVEYDDGRVIEERLRPRDFVEFERKFNASTNALATDPRLEWLYFIGFNAMNRARRQGRHDGDMKATFDGFLDAIEEVTIDFDLDDDGSPVPLDETAPSSE